MEVNRGIFTLNLLPSATKDRMESSSTGIVFICFQDLMANQQINTEYPLVLSYPLSSK